MTEVTVKMSAYCYGTLFEIYKVSVYPSIDEATDTGLIGKYETPKCSWSGVAQIFNIKPMLMRNYYHISSSTGKRSGVRGYDYSDDSITIYFTSGSVYTYTLASCGATHLANMKRLADAQSGLNTYVTRNKPPYASKF
ncbi:MAG: hypothetical protein NC453_17290 [Muribaculum sp.]|nr:hypothetical protein [Muribaculum sp.]